LLEIKALETLKNGVVFLAKEHDTNFIEYAFTFSIIFWLHKLKSTNDAITLSLYFEDFREATNPNSLNNVVELGRIISL
jgi:hypothetical protein